MVSERIRRLCPATLGLVGGLVLIDWMLDKKLWLVDATQGPRAAVSTFSLTVHELTQHLS